MDIKEENIILAYKAADDNGKKLLQALFPNTQLEANKTSEKRPITERIKTFGDAYSELGSEHPFCKILDLFIQTNVNNDISNIVDVLAYLKLRIICAALNEGWKPKFTEDEYRYYPWFYLYSEKEIEEMDEKKKQNINLISMGDLLGGTADNCANNVPSAANANFSSRLCLKSEALAIYCGKQFINIWADFNL